MKSTIGVSKRSELLQRLTRLLVRLLLPLSILGAILAGCATVPTVETASKANVCRPWKKISFSKGDTDGTIKQVRVHDQTGRNLRCWR